MTNKDSRKKVRSELKRQRNYQVHMLSWVFSCLCMIFAWVLTIIRDLYFGKAGAKAGSPDVFSLIAGDPIFWVAIMATISFMSVDAYTGSVIKNLLNKNDNKKKEGKK